MTNIAKSWIHDKKSIYIDTYESFLKNDVETPLDNNYEKVNSVDGLKTKLFLHQKTIIKAMLDLEMSDNLEINGYQELNDDLKIIDAVTVYKVSVNAGVLSEPVGSGKTIDILCLILLQKTPRIKSDINNMNLYETKLSNNHYTTIVRRTYKNILSPTIIFVGISVLTQWANAIKEFTSLKVFKVHDFKSLQLCIQMINNKQVNEYDIILVKNGKVTKPIVFPSDIQIESKNTRISTHIYNIIANMRNVCWSRLILDDFDTISLPTDNGVINALFTWYISSTKKQMQTKAVSNNQFKTTTDMLMYNNYSFSNIMNNNILFYNYNIRNDSSFMTESNEMTNIQFLSYTFNNVNDSYIRYISLIGDSESTEIMEMLNSDAVDTAIEKLGIKTNNISDIFQIMLGKQYSNYSKSTNVLEFIKAEELNHGKRKPMSENNKETYNKTDLFNNRSIDYNYPNIKSLLLSTKIEYTTIKEESGININRVISNIKNGECPVCSTELNDASENVVILKCCGVIVCSTCCFGTVFPQNINDGKCFNCKKIIHTDHLIYLDGKFDLSKIIEYKPVCSTESELRTKLSAILEIIKGVTPVEKTNMEIQFSNLIIGSKTLPDAAVRKILIFSNFGENLKAIKETLDKYNIKNWYLKGRNTHIDNVVNLFKECNEVCVLIINSTTHCAGLNIQIATDIIFAHNFTDENIEIQVIGRAQRIGRTSCLKVHYMLYKNELKYRIHKQNS